MVVALLAHAPAVAETRAEAGVRLAFLSGYPEMMALGPWGEFGPIVLEAAGWGILAGPLSGVTARAGFAWAGREPGPGRRVGRQWIAHGGFLAALNDNPPFGSGPWPGGTWQISSIVEAAHRWWYPLWGGISAELLLGAGLIFPPWHPQILEDSLPADLMVRANLGLCYRFDLPDGESAAKDGAGLVRGVREAVD